MLRTERRHDPDTGVAYPWLAHSTAVVNHYSFYAVDDDFGPFPEVLLVLPLQRHEGPLAGPLTVHIGDRWTYARCVVIPTGAGPLVGQLVMEELDLVADCVTRTLGPRPESSDRPLLRL